MSRNCLYLYTICIRNMYNPSIKKLNNSNRENREILYLRHKKQYDYTIKHQH